MIERGFALALSARAERVPVHDFPPPPVPIVFNFDQGLPAHETIPVSDLKRLAGQVLDRDGGWALEYISFTPVDGGGVSGRISQYPEIVLGYCGLREHLASWIAEDSALAGSLVPENFILTSGASQAIALVGDAFVGAGDGVLMEEVTFPYARRFFELSGAEIATIPLASDGLDVSALEKQLLAMTRRGTRPKLLYTMPTFHLPTGSCIPLDGRQRILELAEAWDFLVLEDSVYADLRYEGRRIPSLFELDEAGRVMQAHSFSKILACGLRVGWIAAPPRVIEQLARVRADLGVSQWMARILASYMAEGLLGPHLSRARAIYKHRRDLTAAALDRYCSDWVDFTIPDGGFYLWLKYMGNRDWDLVARQAAERGVLLRPGDRFGHGDHPRFFRIAYSHVGLPDIEPGIAALGSAIGSAGA